MITSHARGHPIIYINNRWIYKDNGQNIDIERPCIRCGQMPTKEGYDACLGHINNVTSACCGHGVERPYRCLHKMINSD